jgi:hypothetical protein
VLLVSCAALVKGGALHNVEHEDPACFGQRMCNYQSFTVLATAERDAFTWQSTDGLQTG